MIIKLELEFYVWRLSRTSSCSTMKERHGFKNTWQILILREHHFFFFFLQNYGIHSEALQLIVQHTGRVKCIRMGLKHSWHAGVRCLGPEQWVIPRGIHLKSTLRAQATDFVVSFSQGPKCVLKMPALHSSRVNMECGYTCFSILMLVKAPKEKWKFIPSLHWHWQSHIA